MLVVQRLHELLPTGTGKVLTAGSRDERRRPALEPVDPGLDLVAVLYMNQPVRRAPEPLAGEHHPVDRRVERLDRTHAHRREQQRRVVVAGNDDQPVVASAGERTEGRHLTRVRGEHTLEPSKRLRLGAPEGRRLAAVASAMRPSEIARQVRLTHSSFARDKRTISWSFRTTMCLFA